MASQSHITTATNQPAIAPAAETMPPNIHADKVDEQKNNLLIIQPKLTMGSPDDPYEKEADSVADQVMRMPIDFQQKDEQIQRKPFDITACVQAKSCNCQDEDEQIQRKPFDIGAFVQRKSVDGGNVISESVSNRITSSKGGGHSMDDSTRSFMESRMGSDFSPVRIHTDSNAMQLSEKLNAQAFTVGNNVFFNQGKYSPDSESGKRLLAHELTHVVQQGHAGKQSVRRKEGDDNESEDEVEVVFVKGILRPGKGTDGTMTLVTEDGKPIGVTVTYQGNPKPGIYHYINNKAQFTKAEIGGKGLDGYITRYEKLPKGYRKAKEFDLVVIDTRLFSEHGVYELSNVQLAELTELTTGFTDYDFRVLKKYGGTRKARTFEEAKEVIEKMREGKFDYEILQLEQESIKSELYGTEKIYNLFKAYECSTNLGNPIAGVNVCSVLHLDIYMEYGGSPDVLKQHLEDQLRLIGYVSSDPINEFKGKIAQFTINYEKIARDIALRSLDHSQTIAEAEIEKYSSSKEAAQIYKDLSIVKEHTQAAEHLLMQSMAAQYFRDDKSARESKELSELEIKKSQEEYSNLSSKYPLLGLYKMDDILDEDKDFFTSGNIITSLMNKIENIRRARKEVVKNADYLYKLDALKELVYAKQGITKGSTIDLIITDKAAALEADESFVNDILLIVSLALIPFTMGQSAILAFGATTSLTAISIYSAVDAIDTYAYEKMFYDAGLSTDDPSVFWVVVAVAGAGLDMGSVVSVFSKASAIARKYPDLSVDLDKMLAEVKATNFTDDIANLGARRAEVQARINAAIAKKAEAMKQLDIVFNTGAKKLFSRLGSNLILDPTNFKVLADLGFQAAKFGFYRFEEFLLLLARRGIIKDIEKLTSRELAILKKAQKGSNEAAIQVLRSKRLQAISHSNMEDDLDFLDDVVAGADEAIPQGSKRVPFADDANFRKSLKDEEIVPGVDAPPSNSSTSIPENMKSKPATRQDKIGYSADLGVAEGKAKAKEEGFIWIFDNPRGMEHSVPGVDSIFRDANGNYLIIEFKGGGAKLSKGQMTRKWVDRKIKEMENSDTLKDLPLVKELRKAFDNKQLRGRTYITPKDSVTGKLEETIPDDHGVY